MRAKLILAIVFSVAIAPAAFSWELTWSFDADHAWSYFDDDTVAATRVAPSGGVLSVDYPDYSFVSIRYIFLDKDTVNPVFGSNMEMSSGDYLRATLSYTGSKAPTFAYFFLAGGGDAGDDQIYLTGEPGSWQGGTQTFWATDSLGITLGTEFATTPNIYFTPENFSLLDVGTVHDSRRGIADSLATTLASVDAIGIILGYVGTPPANATLNIDEFTVTPEPSILLLSAPLAGFLGWRIRRRSKRTARKV